MKVYIAEKPSVAMEIAKVLGARTKKEGYFEGNGCQVTWVYGHLCTLKEPEDYYPQWKGWNLGALPMVPAVYEVKPIGTDVSIKQLKVIKKLYDNATEIINCGDAGQEGELIQRWVMEYIGVHCPVKRLWISSLTEEAIREGLRNLRPQKDYDTLYQAGLARAEGDWLLGMNCTRLYSLKYSGNKQVLSVGRVQTPTLAMIVNRDLEIENFKPEPYWVLTTKYRNAEFTSTAGRYTNEQEGLNILNKVRGREFSIKDVQQKRGSEQPPQLYDLTALQVDCNRKFGMSAEKTLQNIQSLYEKKLTTYPRVDTKFLTDDIYSKCPEILRGLKDYAQYVKFLTQCNTLSKSKRVFDNSKVTDHHAIIPTGETSNLSNINDYERKVYDLICRRFIAVFYPNCDYAQTTVLGQSNGVEFKATGRTIINEGWRCIYAKTQKDEEEEKDEKEENTVLPKFTVGERGSHVPSLTKKMTTPPKRYTEASLLQAMETAGKLVDDEELKEAMKENGIGRPSSRASIIETLLNRKYIRREKKALISNPAGRDLMRIIKARMLKSPELTGQWEKKLRNIEHGTFTLEAFMEELKTQLNFIINEVKGDNSGQRVTAQAVTDSSSKSKGKKKGKGPVLVYSDKRVKEGDKCPICGKGTVKKSQYGGFYCSEYRTTGCRLTYKG